MLTVAIIGRPNVGKSTLFNRLAGKKMAIVDNTPGITRDRREGKGQIADLDFAVIDTAGLEEAENETMEAKMMRQTEKAVADADIVLLLIDARAGLTPVDEYFARWLRNTQKPIVLVANKCEGRDVLSNAAEAYQLGFGDPVMISAEQGQGMQNLYEAIASYSEAGIAEEDEEENEELMNIAIIGRPNVGKSTLLNQLIGEERSIVGPQAGTTRDAIAVGKEYGGRKLKIIDTAGMRRKSRVTEKVEKLSIGETVHALQFANVVVLLLDGTLGLEKQDLVIADLVVREGRGLVMAINKWDLVEDKKQKLQQIRDRMEKSLPQARGVAVVAISALNGKNTDGVLDKAFEAYETWNKRISTGKLNSWLKNTEEKHTPPLVRGRRLKLRYMAQVSTRPPRFALFTNFVKEFPESYLRYLTNAMREDFDLQGVPIRIFPRKSDNPYENKDKG